MKNKRVLNTKNAKFNDVYNFLISENFTIRQKSSHFLCTREDGIRFTIVKDGHSGIKQCYVNTVLKALNLK